ncbi:MAG TPA: endonuclease/exonuclease/phosphatase family protein [Xanthobacteraceae bacterium]|nr:endonuclease/exonuclease/phosphatase family protein [Xanthobacteraceae bacterium]
MSEIPVARQNHLRRILARAAWIAWVCGMIVTALGFTAPWIPAFDLINEVRPLGALAAIALVIVVALLREGRLLRPTISLALLQVGLLLLPWARAGDTAPSLPPALRLVTFDLGADNSRFDDIADFLLNAHADVVLLQQVSCSAVERLIPKLRLAFPSTLVEASSCSGQALMSKRPWVAGGQITTRTRRPLVVWARLQLANRTFVLSGVHLSGPLTPNEQASDIARLQAHLESQGAAHIVAGDLHLTPFAWKFAQLQNAGLGQFLTYIATSAPSWPAFWPFPAVTTDNVLSTQGFARVSITTGPPLGSNHRPLIADIAFLK